MFQGVTKKDAEGEKETGTFRTGNRKHVVTGKEGGGEKRVIRKLTTEKSFGELLKDIGGNGN